ncbi:MAG: glycosyltransferase family A protein, partial [Candidatus Andersenbacteria bacterium]
MNPLVSIIVPTKNSAQFLGRCLQSIKEQTYQNIELIVVDNSSTDATQEIARKYTDKVFTKGPERSAQRNLGAAQSKGKYLLFIDSDMEVSPQVVAACIEKISSAPHIKAIIIPEESFGEGFWAQCKKLEKSFYIGVDWMEAARFFDRIVFEEVKGYDERMISG